MKFLSSYRVKSLVMWSEQEGGHACTSVALTQAPGTRDWPNTQQGSSLSLLYLREVSGSNLELGNFKEAMPSILTTKEPSSACRKSSKDVDI